MGENDPGVVFSVDECFAVHAGKADVGGMRHGVGGEDHSAYGHHVIGAGKAPSRQTSILHVRNRLHGGGRGFVFLVHPSEALCATFLLFF